MPCVEHAEVVDMRTCFMRVPPQEVVTGVEGMVVGMVVIMLGVMGMIVGLVGIMVGVMGLIVGVVRMMVWGAGLAVFVGWFVIYQIFLSWIYLQVLTRDSVTVSVDAVVYYR